MFDNLSTKLEKAFQLLKGKGRITEINVASTVKEIRKSLIGADVNYKVAKQVTDNIREKALGENVLTSISPGQLLTKIVNDELTSLMGSANEPITIKGSPAIILVAGLQGAGKTTFVAKLAKKLKSQGLQIMLAGCDVYRPAAIEQLKILGAQIEVDVYTEPKNKNVLKIAKNAVSFAKKEGKKVLIIDTAGRLAIDEPMMNEIEQLKSTLNPSETLFVVDSMTGQDAVNTAKVFNDRLDFDGVILTKLDGDTRGGAALSIRTVVKKPIKYISTGETLDAIDLFHPERMANRILGMGDVVSLVEKAQENFDEEEARKLNKKIYKNEFDLNDYLSQLNQIKKIGSMKDIMGMLPGGVGKKLKDIDNDAFKPVEAIIQSMTALERRKPTSINTSRKTRIANGSGTSIQEVNNLLKQFFDMHKMMKNMNKMGGMKKGLAKLMNNIK